MVEARRARSENDGDSLSGDSWGGQMEADEQELAGTGDRDRMTAGLNAPGAPSEANMPSGAHFARGGPRPLPIGNRLSHGARGARSLASARQNVHDAQNQPC